MAAVIIEVIAWAAVTVIGVVLAPIAITVINLVTVRIHPRVRHVGWGTCNGTGEHRGAIFGWRHRRCARCNGGRLIGWGPALRLGAHPIRVRAQQAGQGRSEGRKQLAVSLPLADWLILAVLAVVIALSRLSRHHGEPPK